MDIKQRLVKIYNSEAKAYEFIKLLNEKLEKYQSNSQARKSLSQKDVVLITYGDSITGEQLKNINYLKQLMDKYVGDLISAIHILPMFPYTSDDGFSVINYKEIDKTIGTWNDILKLSDNYDLMYDAVINHISQKSEWFKKCLEGDEKYKNYFIKYQDNYDYSKVIRPRTSPLFSEYRTNEGNKKYLTTFSEDQVDINYESIDAATDIIELLVYYAKNGATFIRLDAIGFLWKESGTTCLHNDKTHEMIKVMREVLDEYVPKTMLITETNVPHKDNISYFGNGSDEAQLVYQFPLPPLTLFSFMKEDATKLSKWADSLDVLSEETTFFNFLASHDGIGLRPTEGILTDEERNEMAIFVLTNGGRINYKTDNSGVKSPYELNINYQDALSSPYDSDEKRIKRFIASQVLLMSVVGIPAIYIHSLLGSRNDYLGVEKSGINRRINREKLDYSKLCEKLDKDSFRKEILKQLLNVLTIRREESAFSPIAKQEVMFLDKRIFAIKRINSETNSTVTVLINVSSKQVVLNVPITGKELFTGRKIDENIVMNGLEFMWIKE